MNLLDEIEVRVRGRAFRPAPNRSLSQWADDEVTLAPSEGGGAGKWRTDAMPFLREIMDVMSDTTTEEVVIMKSSQVGVTVAMVLLVIYYMVEEPTTILFVEPSEDLVTKLSTKRLMPNIASTPVARGRILEHAAGGARHSGNTITQKDFPGGYLVIAWASSPSQLRSLPARVVLKDETDDYDATNEGDPTELAERAATTFADRRKIVDASTPTLKGHSRIEARFADSDQRYFHVPCPDCQHEQVLRWWNVTFDKTDARTAEATARYACESCGSLWDDLTKQAAVGRGRWIPTHPDRPRAGFHISSLYSRYVTLGRLAKEFIQAGKNPEKLMVFFNLKLGETWEDRGDEEAVGGFLARPTFEGPLLPAGVGLLTCFSDVQKDRIETLIMGHGGDSGDELFPIEHHNILRVDDRATPRAGNPEDAERVWRELHALHCRTWQHPSGVKLKLAVKLVDVGYQEPEVLRFTKPRESGRVFGVRGKGRKRPLAPMVSRKPSRNNELAARVWEVNTDKTKDVILRRLRVQQPGPGYVHCPEWFDQEAVDQLMNSERKVPKKGDTKLVYKKIRERNEMLDLFCGNLVAVQPFVCGMTREQIARRAAKMTAQLAAEQPAEKSETRAPASSDPDDGASPAADPDPPPKPRPYHPRGRSSWATRWKDG